MKVCIRSVDTDVVVIAIYCYQYLDIDELWVAFGVGKHYRYIPVHYIAQRLDELKGPVHFWYSMH